MLNYSMLYPRESVSRRAVSLDGMWKFCLDWDSNGENNNWQEGIPGEDMIPVPASFQDFYTDKDIREYTGNLWYEKEIFVPGEWKGKQVLVRFGAATHRATVYVNGINAAEHEGGFLPFCADVTDLVHYNAYNKVVVKVNNELTETNIPCGQTVTLPTGKKMCKPYFDFFNYSGLQRSVWLTALPKESIFDIDTVNELCGPDAKISYTVKTTGDHPVTVELLDKEGKQVAYCEGKEGVLEVKGTDILVNGEPVYLRGFGKHEDSDIVGRGFNIGVMKRDFELMKWIGANSFRTSHYPYSEEIYQMADREGFLIIDEVPAVGLFESLMNFMEASTGKQTAFFEKETTPILLQAHLRAVEEMITRDKNHPSVIAWSLLNEPETTSDAAVPYFKEIFDRARALDPQKRPRTFAMVMNSTPDKCKCFQFSDIIALNRYYGWYVSGGYDISVAEKLFRQEMDAWKALDLNKPFIFTEYGADTLSSEHKLPSVMWSQEYQAEYLKMNNNVFDSYDFVKGEQIWNFADFQTTEGIMRVNGNKKGVFTRQRQPKDIAYKLKERWESLPLGYKG